MKKLNIITTLLALLIVLMGCKKETPTCSFVYSAWTSCSNNIQTRTYTSSPSGCKGTPPADSLQRSCVILPSVQIGSQIWTLKNLDVTAYCNGDVIPEVQDRLAWVALTTGAWCYYENKTENGWKYGKLYNWYAVKDPRGLVPNGYHIPTDAEWTILTDYLGGDSIAGTKMKSTSGWKNDPFLGNLNGNNTSGFNALPGGMASLNWGFNMPGYEGWWWSSTSNYSAGNDTYWYRKLDGSSKVGRSYLFASSSQGLSVRCLKD